MSKVSDSFNGVFNITFLHFVSIGKSSLAATLFRLVELSEGKIIVDGEDISKLHLNVIRSKISTITQDPVLFAESVR